MCGEIVACGLTLIHFHCDKRPVAVIRCRAFYLGVYDLPMGTTSLGIHNGKLAPCPERPNCVSSDAGDEEHHVEPLSISGNPEQAWDTLKDLCANRSRTTILTVTVDYLHVIEKSRFFGFIDDLEFHLRPEEGIIAVRSASRKGHSDLGANRRRVEQIRRELLSR